MVKAITLIVVFCGLFELSACIGITKGTTWCGSGNKSTSIFDMKGSYTAIDRCCRDHDACPISIHRLSFKYNYYNHRLFTISDCQCDEK